MGFVKLFYFIMSSKKTINTVISIIGDKETVTGFLLTGIG